MSDGNQLVPAATHDLSTDTLASLIQLGEQTVGRFQDGMRLRANGDFPSAISAFDGAYSTLQTFRSAVDAAHLPTLDHDDPATASLAHAIDFAAIGDRLIAAFYNHSQATVASLAVEYGNAAKLYSEASRLFEECAGDDPDIAYLAPFSKAQALQAESAKMMRDGNNDGGQERLSAAISLIHTKVMPHISQLPPEDAGAIFVLLASMKIGQSSKAMLTDIIKGDYGSALLFAEQLYKDVAKMRTDAGPINFPGVISQKLNQMLVVMTLQLNAMESLALAGKACEDRAWDIFEQQANMAKMRLVAVQQACLESEETAPFSAQYSQLIDILVEPTRRHGQELRRLYKEMDDWKQSFRSLAGKAGMQIDIQANAEARSKAEQTVSVQVNVANYFQDRATEALLGLKATLAMVPADMPEREELLEKLAEVTSVPKDDPTWLDKVKSFTEKTRKIVENVAKVAGPVAAAWNMLAPLFGAPPLPIPV